MTEQKPVLGPLIGIADLMGDGAILKAMRTNEDDTAAAYERASDRPLAFPQTLAFFQKAFADECRHRDGMERTADML